MILGIALGVAVMVAIDLANSAASRAFDLSTDAIAGRPPTRSSAGRRGWTRRSTRGCASRAACGSAAPVVTDYVTSPQLGDRPIQLLGVDPFAEAPFRSYLVTPGSGGARLRASVAGGATDSVAAADRFPDPPGALLISEGLAASTGCSWATRWRWMSAAGRSTGFVAGLLQPADSLSRRALDGLILADIATAQEITGRLGQARPHRPDPAGGRPCRPRKHSSACCRPTPQIVPVARAHGALAQMTAAFRINLTALSLLALVVGMFLIYNSMTFSVVQRRAAVRHAALPGRHARRDRRAGAGRSGGGRRARLGCWGSAWASSWARARCAW